MKLFNILGKSAALPKKKALFALNRVSMRDTLVYLFLLFFIAFLPNVISLILRFEAGVSQASYSQYLLQIIVFYPFSIMFLVIVSVSILALGGWLCRLYLHRRLAYQQLWKMTGFALLWPLVFYKGLAVWLPNLAFIGGLLLLYILLIQMIRVYPAKR
ncbi:hypothetical protein [Gracilibacillus timonensis]|uniref:hypothetical protein n=1 Tax=Gracilibacillus timonensis TaxID=1816696 RepID=UPI000826F00E|nr:hypothetical protein [Gracilibacillus timonensis]